MMKQNPFKINLDWTWNNPYLEYMANSLLYKGQDVDRNWHIGFPVIVDGTVFLYPMSGKEKNRVEILTQTLHRCIGLQLPETHEWVFEGDTILYDWEDEEMARFLVRRSRICLVNTGVARKALELYEEIKDTSIVHCRLAKLGEE